MGRRATPFWDRVDRSGECWLWTAYRNEDGYGTVRFDGRMQGAHRVAWQLTHGPIPDGLDVLHSCDNPPCCKPDHLFLGTNHDNVIDRHTKGRSKNLFSSDERHPARLRRGAKHWCAKLSDDAVRQIRQRRERGETTVSIGRALGVNTGTVSRIARREWRGEVS